MRPLLLLVVTSALLHTSIAHAGPWSPAQGHGYAKLGSRVLIASRYTDGAGASTDIAGYREVTMQSYAEVGLGAGFTAIFQDDLARLAFVSRPGADGASTTRPGDPELGVRWQLLAEGPWAMALESGVRLPFASSAPWEEVLSKTGEPVGRVELGTGQLDVRGTVAAGWAGEHLDASISFGYLARTGGYDHALRWSAELGGVWSPFFGRIRFGGHHLLGTGSAPRTENISGLGNGTTYTAAIFELGGHITSGLSLGITTELSLFGLAVRRQARGIPGLSLFASFVW